jgi:penicillin amidase
MQVMTGVAQPVDYPKVLTRLLTTPPATLATYDAASGQSILFDDLSTANTTETRDDRGITALLDAVDMLTTRLGADRDKWRWGALHTLRHNALVSLWTQLSIPPPNDTVFPLGYPRHGDLSTVDVGNYGTRPGDYSMMGFSYGSGPVQRFVADMKPGGPVITNALPGGNVWDNGSPHFKDDDELWRRNKTHRVWIMRPDVVSDAKERITYSSKKK